ncbi:MAG: thiolase family protein [Candidatus Helarchaeota archaeon]|nr:thiolase family protein [Candidatus Helarchaeota archaeon]
MKEMKEAVVVDAIRAPMGRSGWKAETKKGQFYYTNAHDFSSQVLLALVKRVEKNAPEFKPEMIEDVAWGVSSQFGEQGGNMGRINVMNAELPDCIAGWTIDRYCNAGLQAINAQAQAIMTGMGDIMVAGGTEFLSKYPLGSSIMAIAGDPKQRRKAEFSKIFMRRTTTMGQAAELIAEKWKLNREDLDKFSAWSHQKAVKAMRDEAWYKKRICPITVNEYDPNTNAKVRDENGNVKKIICTKDETPRAIYVDKPEEAMQKLKALEPRFKQGGVVTAGNSSAISDGTAAVMLMSRERADAFGLKPMAIIRSMAVSGSDPMLMLEGPIPAQEKALKRAEMTMEEMEIIEPNEAFASPLLAFAKHFEYDFMDPRQNPTGGGISLGHPIGCSGVAYFTEMVWALNHLNKKWGIQAICGGGGVGIATVVENTKEFKP